MSDHAEKLEQVASAGGRARARLSQLRERWGAPRELDGTTAPELLLVRQLDGALETWKLVQAMRSAKESMYECIDIRKAGT